MKKLTFGARIKSLLPTLSVSLPAIITGILIFSETNLIDPLTSLLSKSGDEKKEGEEIDEKDKKTDKGKEKGADKNETGESEGKGKDNKFSELGDSDKGSKASGESSENREGSPDGTGEQAGNEANTLGQVKGDGEGQQTATGNEGIVAGTENTHGESENQEATSTIVSPNQSAGEAKERQGGTTKGSKKLFSAFSDFEDLSEEYYDD